MYDYKAYRLKREKVNRNLRSWRFKKNEIMDNDIMQERKANIG